VTQYYRVLDSGIIAKIGLADFQGDDTDVQPIADPTIASLPLKLAKAQALKQASAGNPLYNQREVEKRFLEAIEEPNIEAILLTPEQMTPAPDPKLLEVQGKLEKMWAEIEVMKIDKTKKISETILNIAKAEAAEAGTQIDQYKQIAESLGGTNDGMPPEQGRMGAMETGPIEQQGAGDSGGLPAAVAGDAGGGAIPAGGQPGENGAGDGADSGNL
jgi:hypothetical protein